MPDDTPQADLPASGGAGLAVRYLIGGVTAVVAGSALFYLFDISAIVRDGAREGTVGFLIALVVAICAWLVSSFASLWLAVLAMGLHKLRNQRLQPVLPGSDDTVGDPEAGREKLHAYLTGLSSLESFLGLVPRSEALRDELDDEQPAKPRRRVILTREARRVCSGILAAGAVAAVVIFLRSSGGPVGDEAYFDTVKLAHMTGLLTSALVGAVAATPIALAVAWLMSSEVEVRADDEATGE